MDRERRIEDMTAEEIAALDEGLSEQDHPAHVPANVDRSDDPENGGTEPENTEGRDG